MKTYTVYRLENVVTKKNYIGMTSQKPNKRWCSGYRGKMKEAIDAYPLQLCWKKHIEFQTPNKEQALELESELMKWYDSVENGYNISSYDSHHCKHSEDSKKKMSEAHTGVVFTEEHKKNISESMTGKHLSEESRKKMAESQKGNTNASTKSVTQYSIDGEFIGEYSSTREASRHTGCDNSSISKCCKGKYKSVGGYVWKYKEG